MADVYSSQKECVASSIIYENVTHDALVFAAAYSVSEQEDVRLSHAAKADRGLLRRERTTRNYGLRSLA